MICRGSRSFPVLPWGDRRRWEGWFAGRVLQSRQSKPCICGLHDWRWTSRTMDSSDGCQCIIAKAWQLRGHLPRIWITVHQKSQCIRSRWGSRAGPEVSTNAAPACFYLFSTPTLSGRFAQAHRPPRLQVQAPSPQSHSATASLWPPLWPKGMHTCCGVHHQEINLRRKPAEALKVHWRSWEGRDSCVLGILNMTQ